MDEPTNEAWEDYEFLRLYSIDLERSKQLLQLIPSQASAAVRNALIELAVIAYARPFSANRGQALRKHRLGTDVVPHDQLHLHRELITLRNSAFAHTDHEFRDPAIARFPREDGRGLYAMSFSNPSWESLLGRLQEIEARGERGN